MKELVVITGASTGIGFATAVRLQKAGFQVLACARKPEDLVRLEEAAPGLRGALLDVTDSERVAQLGRDWSNEGAFRKVHLVNNAGIAVPGPIECLRIEDIRKQFDVNVFGLIEVTQAFLPLIRATQGRIVNMSSVSGLSSAPYLGVYSASKFALESISDALRRELAPLGVKVIVIEPGAIRTPIWEKGLAQKSVIESQLRPEILPVYRKPFERFIRYAEKLSENAIPVERVAEAVQRGLTDAEPSTRIVVASGKDRVGLRLARWIPDKWADKVIAKALGTQ